MQAIEKIDISTNWVTLIFLVLLFSVLLLKGFHRTKLKEYFFAFFNKGFIVSEIEERASLLNRFSVVLFFFTTGTFGLLTFFLMNYFSQEVFLEISLFWKTLLFFVGYLTVKRILEKLFVILFSIQTETVSFLTAKSIYTHTISLWTFPVLILFFYAALPNQILFGFILFLFVIKLALLFANNKNLILSKLFYIILYICAFEIAPPFLLFKLMF
ncbi:MAG: DUF4271 domain-containing protein [Polaribacter sp.]|nr:DUF4271 domain-containing protein [Polaribacter sp.]MBT7704603.1 DUF4271 domain-containing protein [Polaribacter sp.]MDB4181269.1 DUF4271 domain-containing protein [Polaribacter sp.]MDB9771042.1 DUF4271 domain-containing protein [Polaribacter sp.]MDG1111482.1 DUF4271 domain-containing protein [Polaribacter sp.]